MRCSDLRAQDDDLDDEDLDDDPDFDDDDEDGEDDEDEEDEEEETWQVRHVTIPLKATAGLTSGIELPRLAEIFQPS
jgi:hypothetical protein